MTLYLLAHPDAVKQVLQDNAANYPRPPFVRDRLQAIVGGGLVGAEGAGWVRSRRMAQPAFRRHQLEGYGAQFVEATTELLDSVLYPLIAERRRSPGGEDLVSMLVDVTDEETGAHLTDKQVRDETISFFIAGHATIASALTWTWYLLSTHPECWRRLRAEVDEVLDGRPRQWPTCPAWPTRPWSCRRRCGCTHPSTWCCGEPWPTTRSAATASRPAPTSPSAHPRAPMLMRVDRVG